MSSKDIEQAGANLYSQLQQGRISRRQFIQGLGAVGLSAAGVSVLAACGTPAPTAAPAARPPPHLRRQPPLPPRQPPNAR